NTYSTYALDVEQISLQDMSMELRQLRYFVAASEAGSLLKASGRLHVAQPALGQQITALEDELGTRLLERSSRGVSLTEAGKIFLEHARLVLADAERARLAVQQSAADPRGEVSLGLTTTVALAATMPILSACRSRLPQVRLKVVEAYSGFLRERLQAGRLRSESTRLNSSHVKISYAVF